jgi:hypothetical protein
MALKKLLWRKYLFIDRTEGETEQAYWNEKRKKHLAGEHSAGIVSGLGVTETGPPSLEVAVAPGRALDADGNDPEVETAQELDLTSLVPGSGTVTAYVTLAFADIEVEPYFVEETGQFQNKYLQDAFLLEAGTTPPAAPAVELARVELAAGATGITDASDPDNPGPNEIDLTHREYSGKEVLTLEDLSDVSPDEAAAFDNMNSPSGTNPIATFADVAAGVAPVETEIGAARGSKASLDQGLDVALGDDGSLKDHAATHRGDGSDPVAAATPSIAGLMSSADKSKLDGVEAGATVAGETGDAHAAVTTGNPHDLDPTDVGAAPGSHVGTGGGEHAVATASAAGFMAAVDKAALDGHIGAGGAAHAAATGALAGFLSAADKTKLDSLAAGVGAWTVLYPAGGSLVSQLSSMSAGDRYWLAGGLWTVGGELDIDVDGVIVAGERAALLEMSAGDYVRITAHSSGLQGFTIRLTGEGDFHCMVSVEGEECFVRDVWMVPVPATVHRRCAIRVTGSKFDISDNRIAGIGRQSEVEFGKALVFDPIRAYHYTGTNDEGLGNYTAFNDKVAMSFVAKDPGLIKRVWIDIEGGMSSSVGIRVGIQSDAADEPSGTWLDYVDALWSDLLNGNWKDFDLPAGASVARGARYWVVVECLSDPGGGIYKSVRGHDADVFPDGRYLYHRSGGSWSAATMVADMSVFVEYDDPLPGPGGRIAGNTIDVGDDPALAHYVSGIAKTSKSYDVAKGCVIERNYFDLGTENYRVAVRPANGWIIVLNRFYEETSANDMAYGIWVSSARLPYYASSVIVCLNSFQGLWADGTCVFMSATNYSVNAFNDMQGGSPRHKSWADAGNFHLFETVTAVMEVKWTGDGTNDRLLSISDHGVSTYHFILVFPDQSFDWSAVHCAMAWDFWGAHGFFDNVGEHRCGNAADPYWQGRSSSQLKLGSNGSLTAGTNKAGRKYKALVISLSGIGSKVI